MFCGKKLKKIAGNSIFLYINIFLQQFYKMIWFQEFSQFNDLNIYQSLGLIRIKNKLLYFNCQICEDNKRKLYFDNLIKDINEGCFKFFELRLHSFIMEDGSFSYSIMAWDVYNLQFQLLMEDLVSFMHPLTYLQTKLKKLIIVYRMNRRLTAMCVLSKKIHIDLVCFCLKFL